MQHSDQPFLDAPPRRDGLRRTSLTIALARATANIGPPCETDAEMRYRRFSSRTPCKRTDSEPEEDVPPRGRRLSRDHDAVALTRRCRVENARDILRGLKLSPIDTSTVGRNERRRTVPSDPSRRDLHKFEARSTPLLSPTAYGDEDELDPLSLPKSTNATSTDPIVDDSLWGLASEHLHEGSPLADTEDTVEPRISARQSLQNILDADARSENVRAPIKPPSPKGSHLRLWSMPWTTPNRSGRLSRPYQQNYPSYEDRAHSPKSEQRSPMESTSLVLPSQPTILSKDVEVDRKDSARVKFSIDLTATESGFTPFQRKQSMLSGFADDMSSSSQDIFSDWDEEEALAAIHNSEGHVPGV